MNFGFPRGLFPGMSGGEPMDMSEDQRFQSLQQRFQMNRGPMIPQEEQNLQNAHSDEDDNVQIDTNSPYIKEEPDFVGEIPNETNDFSMDIYSKDHFTQSMSAKFVATVRLANTTVFIVARAAKVFSSERSERNSHIHAEITSTVSLISARGIDASSAVIKNALQWV